VIKIKQSKGQQHRNIFLKWSVKRLHNPFNGMPSLPGCLQTTTGIICRISVAVSFNPLEKLSASFNPSKGY
jgi:hypothetical protein